MTRNAPLTDDELDRFYAAVTTANPIRPPKPRDVRRLIAEVRERRAAEGRVRTLVRGWLLGSEDYLRSDGERVIKHDAAEAVEDAMDGIHDPISYGQAETGPSGGGAAVERAWRQASTGRVTSNPTVANAWADDNFDTVTIYEGDEARAALAAVLDDEGVAR